MLRRRLGVRDLRHFRDECDDPYRAVSGMLFRLLGVRAFLFAAHLLLPARYLFLTARHSLPYPVAFLDFVWERYVFDSLRTWVF